ncbi:MAG: hypothetical protein L3J82_03955 [Planctomycetes bacterium]|nr:hypothetical protein [Planctomycetota bacterium]
MRSKRIAIGLLIVAAFTILAGAGVLVLRESLSGGVRFSVVFQDTHSLEIDDDVIYGDRVVGRITDIQGNTVHAVVESERSELVHSGSRFWIVSNIAAFLQFDTPAYSGDPIQTGQKFIGFETRPEPDPESLPPQQARPLPKIPAWLCEVRSSIKTVSEGQEFLSLKRKSAAAIVDITDDGHAIVLAPSWVHDVSGEVSDATFLVEMQGDETRLAELIETGNGLSRFLVRNAGYKSSTAELYADTLPKMQVLVLTDHEGSSYRVKFRNNGVDLRLTPKPSLLALVDGFKLAGFATPVHGGRYGAKWVGLDSKSSSGSEASD